MISRAGLRVLDLAQPLSAETAVWPGMEPLTSRTIESYADARLLRARGEVRGAHRHPPGRAGALSRRRRDRRGDSCRRPGLRGRPAGRPPGLCGQPRLPGQRRRHPRARGRPRPAAPARRRAGLHGLERVPHRQPPLRGRPPLPRPLGRGGAPARNAPRGRPRHRHAQRRRRLLDRHAVHFITLPAGLLASGGARQPRVPAAARRAARGRCAAARGRLGRAGATRSPCSRPESLDTPSRSPAMQDLFRRFARHTSAAVGSSAS